MDQVETPQSPRFCGIWGTKVEALELKSGQTTALQRVRHPLDIGELLEMRLYLHEGEGMLPFEMHRAGREGLEETLWYH